jgi:hypothetical protein
MFKLAQALKGHREAGSLNEQINLFGFVDDHTFLTKSGDVGVVLAVKGVANTEDGEPEDVIAVQPTLHPPQWKLLLLRQQFGKWTAGALKDNCVSMCLPQEQL